MFRLQVSLLLLGVLLAAAVAEESRLAVTECPHHPGQCQDPDTRDFHPTGTDWYHEGQCRKYTCAFPEIIITGCPAATGDHCQRHPGDVAAHYPACCDHYQCEDGEHNHA